MSFVLRTAQKKVANVDNDNIHNDPCECMLQHHEGLGRSLTSATGSIGASPMNQKILTRVVKYITQSVPMLEPVPDHPDKYHAGNIPAYTRLLLRIHHLVNSTIPLIRARRIHFLR